MYKPRLTKNYIRQRVVSPSKFTRGSFRTIDSGRVGKTKLVIGRLRAGPHKGKTRVQAILYSRSVRK
jgi:hypothetical protein